MKVATNLALSGALLVWMAAFAQEAVKPAAVPPPAQANAAATTPQDCGQMMEKMHASHMAGMKSGEMMKSGGMKGMKSGCMDKDMSAADAPTAKADEHDHSTPSKK